MGIFDSIKHFIFGKRDEAPTIRQETPPPVIEPEAIGAAAGMSAPLATPPLVPILDEIDVEAILDKEAAAHPGKLDWRTSIVDLMKLAGLDSGLAHRQDLAKELGYSGDAHDSAAMNTWLHKAVMRKLAEDGGQVPAELK